MDRTVKLSAGEPSVVLSADAVLLASPCFCKAGEMSPAGFRGVSHQPAFLSYLALAGALLAARLLAGRLLGRRLGFLLGGGREGRLQLAFGAPLLSQQLRVDVGQDAARRDGHALQELRREEKKRFGLFCGGGTGDP